jgi:hypothetical protein
MTALQILRLAAGAGYELRLSAAEPGYRITLDRDDSHIEVVHARLEQALYLALENIQRDQERSSR